MDIQSFLADKAAQKGDSSKGRVPPAFMRGKKKKKGNSKEKQGAIQRRLAAMNQKR